MKIKFLFVLIILLGAVNLSFSQDLQGYTYHGKDGGVTLYYKTNDRSVYFKAYNERNREVQVKIYGLYYKTKNRKTTPRDIIISWIYPNKTGKNGIYSKRHINYWRFTKWKWTEKDNFSD